MTKYFNSFLRKIIEQRKKEKNKFMLLSPFSFLVFLSGRAKRTLSPFPLSFISPLALAEKLVKIFHKLERVEMHLCLREAVPWCSVHTAEVC